MVDIKVRANKKAKSNFFIEDLRLICKAGIKYDAPTLILMF
jgi:hypothetical protein